MEETTLTNAIQTLLDDEGVFINKEAIYESETYKAYSTMVKNLVQEYKDSKYTRKLSKDVNIDKEYNLIQAKQSKLSKWERDQIVKIYENTLG